MAILSGVAELIKSCPGYLVIDETKNLKYGFRWKTEEVFRVLKSGLGLDGCQ